MLLYSRLHVHILRGVPSAHDVSAVYHYAGFALEVWQRDTIRERGASLQLQQQLSRMVHHYNDVYGLSKDGVASEEELLEWFE